MVKIADNFTPGLESVAGWRNLPLKVAQCWRA